MRVAPRAVQDSPCRSASKFSATHRLLRQDGFDHVVRAENVSDKYFRIFFVRNAKECARLGIIVGKRTIPGATRRNRIKRVIREAFRQHWVNQCKVDLVVMVRNASLNKGLEQTDGLKMLLSRLGSRCAEF